MIKRYNENLKNLLTHMFLILFTLFLTLPFFIMIGTSLKPYKDIITWPPKIIPNDIQISNFIEAWSSTYNLKTGFINSTIISGSTMVLCILLGSIAAYALARFKFVGKRVFLFLILTTQMFSQVVLIVPLYNIMNRLGLLNTYTSLILANTAVSLPMCIWMLVGFFKEMSPSLEEAAMIDGCSRLKAIFKIVFPICAPSIVAVGIFSFINTWNDVLFSMIFITDPKMRPITLMLLDFKSQYQVHWNLLMAGAVIAVIPITILFIGIQKYLVKGLVSGTDK